LIFYVLLVAVVVERDNQHLLWVMVGEAAQGVIAHLLEQQAAVELLKVPYRLRQELLIQLPLVVEGLRLPQVLILLADLHLL
jgi:hypothetical protein